MFIDHELLFSDQQAITATAASTNSYDRGTSPSGVNPDAGAGNPIGAEVRVDATFDNLTSLSIAFQSADDSAFSTNLTTHWTVSALLAALVLQKRIKVPPLPAGLRRYWRFYYTVVGTAPDTGKVSAWLTATPTEQANVPPPDNIIP